MARSGNLDVSAELAQRLSLHYAYTPEYLELTRGSRAERAATLGGANARGLHGNAILSRWPLRNVRRVALPVVYDWYTHVERRIGTRVALVATLELPSGPLDLVSTHLEAFATPAERAAQLAPLYEALPNGRAILGGDLNTLGVEPNLRNAFRLFGQLLRDHRRLVDPVDHEPLFGDAARAGFAWREANDSAPTWGPHASMPRRLCAKLDWVLLRGVHALPGSGRAAPAMTSERLSDHDGVVVTVRTKV